METYRLFRRWSIGKDGELQVLDVLRSLPNDYVILNDLMLPRNGGNIDHFLIGSNGLFVIETKNYSGYVRCDGDRWFVGRREINSLSKQAKRNSIAIRANLASLHAEKGVRVPYVNALLVFVNKETKSFLNQRSLYCALRNLSSTSAISRLARPISNNQQHAIVRHLQSLQNDAAHSPVRKQPSRAIS